ncbi:uncharacterized protein LOC134083467 [Sardina pilchardus]|uniref:uncharacterized protein LOC134083467 n=1 Tax=Sardina pilchardus TaxID=27697 RepID=UPI002E0E62DA
MIESHGRIPPINVRVTYALGIVTLFPNLKDKASPTGYEHYYDPHSGQGYLAYRLKTVQRNTTSNFKRSPKSADQHGPKTQRETSTSEQLSGDECREVMSVMKHSADQPVVREKMKATFKHRQSMLHDPDQSSVILDHFPRFLDTPGLINQDFTMLFGEDVSGKFIVKWPTFYKPRIITVCESLRPGTHVDDLLSAQEEMNDYGWDSDLAAILLLIHLLPPTAKGKRHGKISATEATDHVVKFMKVGTSMVTFLDRVGSAQPFLLCVGEKKSSIQKFYVILDQKAIPCMAQTAVAAFDELFKAHFVFAQISAPWPAWPDLQKVRQTDDCAKLRYSRVYDTRHKVRPLPELQPGTSVAVKLDNEKGYTKSASVVQKCGTPQSYIVQMAKGKLRRNRHHLRPILWAPMARPQEQRLKDTVVERRL